MTNEDAAPDEMQRVIVALRDALTDSMVERLATTAGVALEVIDRLNEKETRDAVHTIIDRITEFHRIGALDTLFETVLLLHAMRSAATDSIVERLFSFIEQTANTLGTDAVAQCADNVMMSLEQAAKESAQAPQSGGVWSTISLLAKPESQQSLQFLLKFGEVLRRAQTESWDKC
jgi:uncharacterized protein YjgD (DUF1641 family)